MIDDDSALSGYEGYDWERLSGVPAPDALFRALSHRQRRRVLWFLLERPETALAEVADVLVGWELKDGEDAAGPEKHRRVLAALHHHHLPVLAESDLVEYDVETGAVRLSAPPEPIRVLIKFSYQYERAVAGRGV
ncbi:DUF7344 domain-containing protein [Halogeometricum luteum]|uniref:Helix-turn-helix domain-containing protein n=1 Tax=Halogeometricum luteum TaxID=2950537 RepID=A0ABU2G7H4_9EURY|nr:hypothetical protein [Halogeometricum sp. S3BR5-2]MDS0296108.1 helix-turn-helix domain-containing protein [Halogeometricum sp. S3BR5-2]